MKMEKERGDPNGQADASANNRHYSALETEYSPLLNIHIKQPRAGITVVFGIEELYFDSADLKSELFLPLA
jgi:hypothetical protein